MRLRRAVLGTLVLACTLSPSTPLAGQDAAFDILIRNGRVLDGTGNPYFLADVGIQGDRIVAVGRLTGATAARTIEAAGLHVAPGFIDLHSHADQLLASDNVEARRAHNLITQGITTVVGGADGRKSAWPLSAERAAYERLGIGQNVVLMVGHNTVRREVMGDDYEREATPEEIARMQALVRQGMEEGAWGLGAGLEYRPARFSSPAEVVDLARVVADYNGFYIAHQRDEALFPMWYLPGVTDEPPMDGHGALTETVNIARETGIRVVASHIKTRGRASWGRSQGDVHTIARARAEGLRVYMDQYPYNTGGGPREMVPGWAFAPPGFDRRGGQDDPRLRDPGYELANFEGTVDQDVQGRQRLENLRTNLANPETRRLIERDIDYLVKYWSGPETHIIVASPDSSHLGRSLAEVSRARDETPVETVLHYSLRASEETLGGRFTMRVSSMNESDVENYMRQEWTATSSDATIDDPNNPSRAGMHPRLYGAFARKIAEYVKDRRVISLPFAIRAGTSLPAQIIGLRDRGYVRAGQRADIVVFDYESLRDRATVMEPNRHSEGVEYVLVNGLGLAHTFTMMGDVVTYRFAVGHSGGPGRTEVVRPFELATPNVTAGGVAMSVTDLLTFARFHLDGTMATGEQVLSPSSLELMRTPQHRKRPTQEAMGIGWHLRRLEGVLTLAHGGTDAGHVALVELVPERRFILAILTNHRTGWRLIQDVERAALALYEGLALQPNEPITNRGVSERLTDHVSPLPAQPEIGAYVGTYRRPPRGTVHVREARGGLIVAIGDGPGAPILFYGPDVAFDSDAGRPYEFIRTADGSVGWDSRKWPRRQEGNPSLKGRTCGCS